MKLLLAITLAAFTAASHAQDFYAGVHAGQAKAASTCDGVSGTGITCDDKSTAWKAFGGYRFHQNFAAELAYTDLGNTKATSPTGSITASSNAFDLSLVGSLPVWQRLSAYARLGVYRANTELNVNTVSVRRTDSETNTGMLYGVGASYDFTKRFAVRAEWQKYNDVGGSSTGKDDITMIALGVLLRF